MRLTDFTTLGRSGLKVSPVCLGTMTFGEEWGWGSKEETAKAIFAKYIELGGNFIDTADGYTNGTSEEMCGRFINREKLRDKVVLATKFTFNAEPGNPNAGGNGRKNIYRALEGSLKRLGTDYIDLYWLHAWDTVTPLEEVLLTLNDLVREGKVRHVGLSDVPAWYLAKWQTLSSLRLLEPVAAMQLEYSLVERTIEREHVPAAREFGVGICPWSPLASGFLSGKYKKEGNGASEGRLSMTKESDNPVWDKFTPKNWAILEEAQKIAKELGCSAAQVALSWVYNQPGVTSTLIGATKIKQLEDNLAALEIQLPAEALKRLNALSKPENAHPYMFFEGAIHSMVAGGTAIRQWHPSN